jgi:hypothetical protein
MAKAAGVSHRSVQRVWAAHGLKPHRVRTFKLSNDPKFAAKVQDVVGLHVDPPEHALVLSLDEKSQIQALDRTQPGLPMKKGRCGTMTHATSATARRGCSPPSMCSTAVSSASAWRATGIRNSSASSTRSIARPGRSGTPPDRRQLRDAQASQGPRLARTPSAVSFPLHPDIGLMAQ